MCGITAYFGRRNAIEVLLKALKMLEYRGYDSAGFATLSDSHIAYVKDVGKIEEIEGKYELEKLGGNVGIAHTRWATHGGVTKENAHPHFDCKMNIALVHNGIIENYAPLKKELEAKGHVFRSQTDSEVIAHLIEEEMKTKGLKEAIFSAVKKLQGSYALAILFAKQRALVCVRNFSPLIIGLGSQEFFIASDITALLPFTSKVIVMEDGDVAFISQKGLEYYRKGSPFTPRTLNVDWTVEMAQKGGYEHFMLKEIHEQVLVARNALSNLKSEEVCEMAKALFDFEKVHVVAAGTSYHASLLFAYMLVSRGINAHAFIASEYPSLYSRLCDEGTLVFAVSQSGETADVLRAVRAAKRMGATVCGIVNVMGSSLTREADATAYIKAGPEIGVAATKTYVAQLITLGSIVSRAFDDGILEDALKRAPERIKEALELEDRMKALAKEMYKCKDFFFIGRGFSWPTASEGALKLKEISYAHAEAYPGGELKHGPLSLLEPGFPVFAIMPEGKDFEKMLGNAQECRARGARVICLSNTQVDFELIKLSEENEEAFQIQAIVPLQLFSYYCAVLRGNDPDKPRNLAKSVTVD